MSARSTVLGIAGYSGSGKTTLVVGLIPELVGRGFSVSTVKHTHHNVSIDRRGDATRRLRDAGAVDVIVAGDERWAVLHEHRGAPEASLDALVARMAPVDLVLVEGFKKHDHDKIEVHRPALGKPLLCAEDARIVAVATDAPLAGIAIPRLDLNDVAAIADFVVARCGLVRRREVRRDRGPAAAPC